MSFSFPFVLFLLPLTLLFLRRPKHNPITLSSLSGWQNAAPPRRVKWLKLLRILRFLSFALLLIALAGPRTEQTVNEEIRQGIAIEMLADISSSMDRTISESSAPKNTRMDASKQVIEAFIKNRPDDLIGLITFARYADTLSPLTFGHSALVQLVQELEIQNRPNEDGTAYGDALMLACAHLARIDEPAADQKPAAPIQSKIIILLTDGENNCGLHLPQEAAGLAKKWGIRLYTISLSESGDASKVLTDAEALLKLISEATGGAFWKIHTADELTSAYETIDRLEKTDIKSSSLLYKEYRTVFMFFALPALLLLLLEQTLNATLLRVTEEA